MKGARSTVIAIAIATLVVSTLSPYWTAAALISRAAGTAGWPGVIAQWSARGVSDTIEQIPIRDVRYDRMRVRIFRPDGAPRRAALLVSGVHRDGIKEPRLVALARELAATGVIVVTPEIEDLINYRLTARATDTIEDAAVWMVKRPDLFGPAPIGLIGVSFAGGLAIVVAGRPTLNDRLAYVLSFGGHGNLPRVLKYLCTGIEPAIGSESPRRRPPHDYALAVLAHQAAEHAVPSAQVAPLRQAIETFLQASALNRTSRDEAARLFDEARKHQAELPEPSHTLMKLVNDRDVAALGRFLGPHIDRLGQDASLSPDRSAPPSAPVYLLHGADDQVIPAVESALLAQHLRPHTRVRQLLSRYLTHVDVAARPTMKDTWDMVAFWKAVLAEY
jgi:dienelactone hydrolase